MNGPGESYWKWVTTAKDPDNAVYGTSLHIPSARDYGEWSRELEASGTEAQASDESDSHKATFQYHEDHLLGQYLPRQLGHLGRRYSLEYENETASSRPEDAKIANMTNETEGALQGRLRLHAISLEKYSKQVIVSNFRARQIVQGSASSGPAPMEVDAVWKGRGKGDKGKGKGAKGA